MKIISELNQKKFRLLGTWVRTGALGGLVLGLTMFFFYGTDWLLLFRFFLGGGLIGLTLSAADRYFLLQELSDKLFFYALLLRSLIFSVLILFSVHFASSVVESIISETTVADAFTERLRTAFTGFGVVFLATTAGVSGLMLARLTGFEWLISYFAGRYHMPTKEERIFMQANLDAEGTSKLDNTELCALLQDFYIDLNEAVTLSDGEIYQCRDSEIIVTWVLGSGRANYRPIECYLMMLEKLSSRSTHYARKFGVLPQIKCGIHCGEVVTAWVGDTKKSLIFRGDAPHITARIQAVCNLHHASLLISSEYYDAVQMPREFSVVKLPALSYKGKSAPISVLKLENLS
jgi:adenylate cyclase